MMSKQQHTWIERRISIIGVLLALVSAVPSMAQWKRATLPPPYSTGYYLDVFFLPSDTRYGWACSIDGYVVRTTDGGVTWRGTSPGRPFLEYVQFLTPLIGYTSGPAGIYRSDDGGATWADITPLDPNDEQSWGSYFLNQNEGVYLVGGCSTGLQTFYRTTNGGASWVPSYGNERNSGLSDAVLYKDGSGYAVSSGVIWETSTYGASWRKHSNTPRRVWHEELAINGSTFLIPYSGSDCSGSGKSTGGVLFSHDNAITWTDFNTGQNMFGTCLITRDIAWAVGDGTSAYYTIDGGKTWEERNCGLEGDLDDVYFIGDTLGWIAGDGLYKYSPQQLGPGVTIFPAGPVIDICEGDSILLSGSLGFSSYRWSDGVTGQTRYAKDQGVYTLNAYDQASCQMFEATVTLRYYPSETPRIVAGATEACQGDSIRLDYVGGVDSAVWSTGDTTASIYVHSSGTFYITTYDTYGCKKTSDAVTVTIHPTPTPTITANRRTTICLDEQITLSATPGFRSYLWSNGETQQTLTTSSAGTYSVVVVDEYGCVGFSDSVTVTVLETRNKVDIQAQLPNGVFELPPVNVGSLSTRAIIIRNASPVEDLILHDPTFIGNVFFSIPKAQLPLVIPPQSEGNLVLVCSPIDTGLIADTLILPDTCSPTYIPVVCTGLPIEFQGTSRCELPVNVLVIRAGVAHYLSAPYPLPANDRLTLTIAPPIAASATMVDALGNTVANPIRNNAGSSGEIDFDVRALPIGQYQVVVYAENSSRKNYSVVIMR